MSSTYPKPWKATPHAMNNYKWFVEDADGDAVISGLEQHEAQSIVSAVNLDAECRATALEFRKPLPRGYRWSVFQVGGGWSVRASTGVPANAQWEYREHGFKLSKCMADIRAKIESDVAITARREAAERIEGGV